MHDPVSDPLVAGLAQGRDEAFAALYDRFGRSLFRVAWTLLRSRQDAEDAVQEVFLGLFRSRAALGRIENLRAYLFSVLRHATTRLAAARKENDPSRPMLTEPPGPDAGPDSIDPELSDWLDRALAALPREQREVLTLKIDGELTFEEVAAVLGVSLGTAASRYRYAVEKLRARFNEDSHASRSTAARPT
jgi:RNA polymerase sigma-70 factor (ECF subfamily)